MNRILIIFMLVNMNVNLVFAKQIIFSPDNLIQRYISYFGPTRISAKNAKIVDVFVYPENIASVHLHDSGDLFVIPNEQKSQHIYLTILTDVEAKQDLRLDFSNRQPEPLNLVLAKGDEKENCLKEIILKKAKINNKKEEL